MVAEPQDVLAEFAVRFRLPELVILRRSHWALSLRPDQVTLGSMVISANGPVTSFADLDPAAGAELVTVMGEAERIARRLGAERVNFLALMMKDPLVHLHVLPRYAGPVELDGIVWTDGAWPGPPTLDPLPLDDEQRARLLAHLVALSAA